MKLFSELFTNRFFENTFVSFEVRQTIYEIFKVLKVQKRIVSAETIRINTVFSIYLLAILKFS